MLTSIVWGKAIQRRKDNCVEILMIYENLLVIRLFSFNKGQEISLNHITMLISSWKFSFKVSKLGRKNRSKKLFMALFFYSTIKTKKINFCPISEHSFSFGFAICAYLCGNLYL